MNESVGKEKYISLAEAGKISGYSQEYLSLRARQGKLGAVKFGRNWLTKEEWIEEYVAKVNGDELEKVEPIPKKSSDEKFISLQEGARISGYSQEYLSLRARQGKLKAVRFGRNWLTKEEWVKDYIENNNKGLVSDIEHKQIRQEIQGIIKQAIKKQVPVILPVKIGKTQVLEKREPIREIIRKAIEIKRQEKPKVEKVTPETAHKEKIYSFRHQFASSFSLLFQSARRTAVIAICALVCISAFFGLSFRFSRLSSTKSLSVKSLPEEMEGTALKTLGESKAVFASLSKNIIKSLGLEIRYRFRDFREIASGSTAYLQAVLGNYLEVIKKGGQLFSQNIKYIAGKFLKGLKNFPRAFLAGISFFEKGLKRADERIRTGFVKRAVLLNRRVNFFASRLSYGARGVGKAFVLEADDFSQVIVKGMKKAAKTLGRTVAGINLKLQMANLKLQLQIKSYFGESLDVR